MTHFTNRGYTFNKNADNLAMMYATGNPAARDYIRSEAALSGFVLQVDTFPTSTYRQKYQELVNTPHQTAWVGLYGAYIEATQQTVTVTIVTT